MFMYVKKISIFLLMCDIMKYHGEILFFSHWYDSVYDFVMRHEESTITPDNVRAWLDTNYLTLSKSEHSYLGVKQVDAAYRQVIAYVERMEMTDIYRTNM